MSSMVCVKDELKSLDIIYFFFCQTFRLIMSGFLKVFGLDKVAKLPQIVKQHGGLKASLYHLYRTDDLKVCYLLIMTDSLIINFRPGDLLEKTNMETNTTRMMIISTVETAGSSTTPCTEWTTTPRWSLPSGSAGFITRRTRPPWRRPLSTTLGCQSMNPTPQDHQLVITQQ